MSCQQVKSQGAPGSEGERIVSDCQTSHIVSPWSPSSGPSVRGLSQVPQGARKGESRLFLPSFLQQISTKHLL